MNSSYLIPLVAAGIGFAAVLMGVYGIMGFFAGAGNMERIKDRVHGTSGVPGSPLLRTFAVLGKRLREMFSNLGTKVAPRDEEEISEGRLKLVQAGIRSPEAYKIFQGSKLALAVFLLGSFLGIRQMAFSDMGLSTTLFLAVGFAALGAYAPDFWLRFKRGKRLTGITNALPDSLDLLVVCVESGMGLDQAITRVCEEMKVSGPEISEELYLLTLELRAGKKRSEALKGLSLRVDLEDLRSLVSLLIQADIFGISIGRTLRVYSDAMRKKRQQKAEEAAAKLPVKLMIPLVLFILPALFITILGPAGLMIAGVLQNMPQ